mgnify:CR=1 FL=1
MIALLFILGAAALHQLPAVPPPLPLPCTHPVLVRQAGRLAAQCQATPQVPLGQVLKLAGYPNCAPAAQSMIEAGSVVEPGEDCSATITLAPAPTRLALGLRLDLNRATEQDLSALPRIGPALARRIVADRSRRGPFASVEALNRVKGIGPAIVGRIRLLVSAGDGVDEKR